MLAFKIISNFFNDDQDNDENLLPSTNEKGELQFGVNNIANNTSNAPTFDF